MDIEKTYDKVDLYFLHLVLSHIGVPIYVMRWILACVSSTNVSILINEAPTCFFQSSRGMCKGFPLLSLLFLLVVEGLNRMITKAKLKGFFIGIKLAPAIYLTPALC